MARKNTISGFPIFGASGCDLSVASTTSAISAVEYLDNIGVMVNWTGSSPVGELFFDASNDYAPSSGLGTWQALDFGSQIIISGNTGSHTIAINQLPYRFVRARYVKTSGTGTLIANLSAKQIGG